MDDLCEFDKNRSHDELVELRKIDRERIHELKAERNALKDQTVDPDTITISRAELEGMRRNNGGKRMEGLPAYHRIEGWNALIDKLLKGE